MSIYSVENPNSIQSLDIERLYKRCNDADGTDYTFDLDTDFVEPGDKNLFFFYNDKEEKIVATVVIFAPSKAEAEIVALTDPEYRNRGYFKSLLEVAVKEIKRRNIESILFVNDSNSVIGRSVIDHIGAVYEESEFLLKFEGNISSEIRDEITLSPIVREDGSELIRINRLTFPDSSVNVKEWIEEYLKSDNREVYTIRYHNKIVGRIGIYLEERRDYIFGFSIDPKFQGRGIGSYVLRDIVRKYHAVNRDIVLEVAVENKHALNLYLNAGFKQQAEFRYSRYSFE